VLAAGCAVISGYGAMISLSRGAVLLLGVGVVVILLVRVRTFGTLVGSGLAMVSACFLAYVLTPTAIREELLQRFAQDQGGDYARSWLQQAGLRILLENPWGIGFGNFREFATNGGAMAGRLILAHSHSLYIQIGLDYGWLGWAGFLTLVVYAVTRGLLRARIAECVGYSAGFVAALCGFMAQAVHDYFFFETASLVAFAVLVLGSLAPALTGDCRSDTPNSTGTESRSIRADDRESSENTTRHRRPDGHTVGGSVPVRAPSDRRAGIPSPSGGA
jgi:hypothetical protein